MQSAVLKIVGWNKSKAWTDNVSHTRNMLVGLLRSSTPMTHTEAKRMVKAVLAREAFELPLRDATFYSSMRHALQSIGADVEVQELAQPTVQADGPASGGSSA